MCDEWCKNGQSWCDEHNPKFATGIRNENVKAHNKFVKDQFEKAKTGETICLTDMMISKERLILDEMEEVVE